MQRIYGALLPVGSVIMQVMHKYAWRLDPSHFPRRIDLDLSEVALERLQRLSAQTGRSIRDIAADLLCQGLADQGRHKV